jgi:hypothetical protein
VQVLVAVFIYGDEKLKITIHLDVYQNHLVKEGVCLFWWFWGLDSEHVFARQVLPPLEPYPQACSCFCFVV